MRRTRRRPRLGQFAVVITSVLAATATTYGDPPPSGHAHCADALSSARNGIPDAATVACDKVFIGGGFNAPDVFDVVDIYDPATDTWSTAALSFGRKDLAAVSVCGKAIFAGGFFFDGSTDNGHSNLVDIYDCATDSWSTAELSIGRENIGATVVGDKALFAGGHGESYLRTSRVDIYDCATDTWSTVELSEGRELPGAATVGHLAIFAGGRTDHYAVTDRVDVYDSSTDTWYIDEPLSQARMGIAAVTVGNKAIFAGGYARVGGTWVASDVVDIYDLDADEWTTPPPLSEARGFIGATALGSQALFGGGVSGPTISIPSDVVDVYDADTETWSLAPPLSLARTGHAAATVNGVAMFMGGGNPEGNTDIVDIYTPDCNHNGNCDHRDILDGGSEDCNENWIPDECDLGFSEKIVFSGQMEEGDPTDVFHMDPDGTNVVNLTAEFDTGAGRLSISPDGTLIAFATSNPPAIWAMNADGSDPTEVRSGLVSSPRWYSDTILFYTLTLSSSCPFSVEIRSIEYDGEVWGNDALVVANAAAIVQNTTETFAISPDRSMLVWEAQMGCQSPTYDIYICDLAGTVCTDPRPFFTDEGDDQMDSLPIWSPDSQTVYWMHDATPGVETPKAIVKKAVDSALPVTECDEVVRPPCTEPDIDPCLGVLHGMSPDGDALLFGNVGSPRDLYVLWLDTPPPNEDVFVHAYGTNHADWGFLAGEFDCNGNGIPDECETPESIVDSDPQDGSIDARIPFEMEGGSPYGLQEIELTLDGPGASLTEQDFAVNEVGGDGTAPVVTGIEFVACETVRLYFSEPIEVGAWTTVTHIDSGASVTLGYLPADADGSGCSNANDIIQEVAWVHVAQAGGSPPLYSADIDRSGVVTANDIAVLIDLLNGVGAWVPYFDVCLP